MFARFGRPDEVRIVLAWAEVVGAGLFIYSRTFIVGGLVLVAVLAWAAGFHFALGQPTAMLWLDLSFVLALLAVARSRQPRSARQGNGS